LSPAPQNPVGPHFFNGFKGLWVFKKKKKKKA